MFRCRFDLLSITLLFILFFTNCIIKITEAEVSEEALIAWVGCSEPSIRAAAEPSALAELLRRYRPDLLPPASSPRAVCRVLQEEFGEATYCLSDSPLAYSDGPSNSARMSLVVVCTLSRYSNVNNSALFALVHLWKGTVTNNAVSREAQRPKETSHAEIYFPS